MANPKTNFEKKNNFSRFVEPIERFYVQMGDLGLYKYRGQVNDLAIDSIFGRLYSHSSIYKPYPFRAKSRGKQ